MKVRIKKLNENAVIPYKTYDKDFCYDVVAVSEEEIAPNVWKYGLGLAFQLVRDNEFKGNLSIDFRPRSSVYKTGMVLSNCTGTVDELFTGEVSAVFYHIFCYLCPGNAAAKQGYHHAKTQKQRPHSSLFHVLSSFIIRIR